jgi:hypothetical protein
MPWDFGFDFDLNNHSRVQNCSRGTCVMFSVDEPPPGVQTGRGLDTPECALKWDKDLKANAWCNMGADRMETVTCEDVAHDRGGVLDRHRIQSVDMCV